MKTEQIKFRGKAISGEWVIGNYIHSKRFKGCSNEFRIHESGTGIEHDVHADSVGQFTGLTDKNGNEIYDGDVLRVKHLMGDNEVWYFDGYFKVNKLSYEGISLSFIKLANDDAKNQLPISPFPSFKKGSLCVDYRNQKYNNLAFEDTNGENRMLRRAWKENHYSNDIEIIGTAFESPELLM